MLVGEYTSKPGAAAGAAHIAVAAAGFAVAGVGPDGRRERRLSGAGRSRFTVYMIRKEHRRGATASRRRLAASAPAAYRDFPMSQGKE